MYIGTTKNRKTININISIKKNACSIIKSMKYKDLVIKSIPFKRYFPQNSCAINTFEQIIEMETLIQSGNILNNYLNRIKISSLI